MTKESGCAVGKRILIIGNSGSGKTTFARSLAEKTALPLVHLDRLFWRGNWESLPKEEFDPLLKAELEKEAWIIDGNFSRTLPMRLQYCDTVFYLDFPTVVCLWGITKRLFQYYNRTRPDMGGVCIERLDKEKIQLYKAVLGYNKRHRERYRLLLSEQTKAKVITFHSRKEVRDFLQAL